MRPGPVYLTVLFIAACGLGYELVAAALSSYLLGDSVAQFSIAIGLYMFAMGVGAWLSKFVEGRLAARFVDIEIAVALAGGTSAAVLFLAFERGAWFRPILYGEILLVGILVGLEIPLLLRLLKDDVDFKELVAKVLSFDYVGALVVSLLFPLLLVPHLGMVKSAFAFGLVNAIVALWSTWIFAERLRGVAWVRARCALAIVVLAGGTVFADELLDRSEAGLYGDDVVLSRSTPYQRIVVANDASGFRLYLNGGLQFASADEYRYHEALVHPAMGCIDEPRRVLILGGGDGLALREVLEHRAVERVTLVDLDPAMTDLARDFEPLARLNARSLSDPRVTVVNDDAMRWLASADQRFDVVIVDFPDPSNFSLGKLYTTNFYERVERVLDAQGVFAVQSTSPLSSRQAFWCIVRTVEASGFAALPYHASVPSFGEWGFVLASRRALATPERVIEGQRYVDARTLARMFDFPPDMARVDVRPNELDDQALVRYYEEDWSRWN